MNKALPTPALTSDDLADCDHKPMCKPAGRPRASELEARAQNLIHIAGQLFLQHGYGKVSLETIAREAHVAVRTIYVKFGGKAGLLKAAIEANRDQFFTENTLESDTRPLPAILHDFGLHFYDMLTTPVSITMQRMVIAEARTSPELAETFFNTGPGQTREILARFFHRPDIRAQLRDDIDIDLLPVLLINCVIGDQFSRFLFDTHEVLAAETKAKVPGRVTLFLRAALREAGQ